MGIAGTCLNRENSQLLITDCGCGTGRCVCVHRRRPSALYEHALENCETLLLTNQFYGVHVLVPRLRSFRDRVPYI